jgi:hypothetical protein
MSKPKTLPAWKLYVAFIIAGLLALAYAAAVYWLPAQ